ncbi:response regulator [Patescibacteria group bacterium]|nr:response regulator [Patescibacteria group bacterium]
MTIFEIILIVIVICLIYIIISRSREISGFKERIEKLETELVRRPIEYEKPKPIEFKEAKRKPEEKPLERSKPPKKKIATSNGKKIIMIEDDPFIRDIFTEKFQKAGFEIKTFDSGSEELVREIAEEKPDIISMDIILPGINGIEVTKLLKKDEKTKDIPIIALGILDAETTIEDAIDAGMEDYYVKADQRPSDYVKAIDNYLKNPRNYKRNYKRLGKE